MPGTTKEVNLLNCWHQGELFLVSLIVDTKEVLLNLLTGTKHTDRVAKARRIASWVYKGSKTGDDGLGAENTSKWIQKLLLEHKYYINVIRSSSF